MSLEKVLSNLDIRRAENCLLNTLTKLSTEKEFRIKELVIKIIPQVYIGLSSDLQKQHFDIFASFRSD